jgi:hypothetical protein
VWTIGSLIENGKIALLDISMGLVGVLDRRLQRQENWLRLMPTP